VLFAVKKILTERYSKQVIAMDPTDTIVALATAQGQGALALIRVSGERSATIVQTCIAEKEKFEKAAERIVQLYTFIHPHNTRDVIDRITAIRYRAPRSYTSENMVEILCHGGDITPERILESLVDAGARYAGRGEFTKRAFLNGKTSLTKAEAVNRIIASTTAIQQQHALGHYLGGGEALVLIWDKEVRELLADIENAIEFSAEADEDRNKTAERIETRVEKLKTGIMQELKKRRYLKEVEHGIDVAIVGPVNAGKSSLFNLIMGYERSIVDTEEGTTRDFISEQRKIDGIKVRFIDTAGIRNASKCVEKKGIEKSREFIKKSRIVLWVSAANEQTTEEEKLLQTTEQQKVVGIINKIDLAHSTEKQELFCNKKIPYLEISAIKREEKERVELFIRNCIYDIYNRIEYDCVIGNKRQEKIIEEILKEVEAIKRSVNSEEIAAEHCKNIIGKIEEFTGKITTEEILNKIFDEFCIGK